MQNTQTPANVPKRPDAKHSDTGECTETPEAKHSDTGECTETPDAKHSDTGEENVS